MIIVDDIIADMLGNEHLNPIVTELFIRGRKLNIYLVFIRQFYSALPKNIKLSSESYFIIKIPKKQQIQQIPFNNLSDIGFGDFEKNVMQD